MNCANDIELCGLNEETQEIECSKVREDKEDMSNITMSRIKDTTLVIPDSGINCCWLVFDKPHYDTTGKRRTITNQDFNNEYLDLSIFQCFLIRQFLKMNESVRDMDADN